MKAKVESDKVGLKLNIQKMFKLKSPAFQAHSTVEQWGKP